ncbi:HET-domain-containing protein [Melanomma pulvis-pyrius CBS 109.77]|uniref:HET-domain-containing protein n=1 Tax=Melanomma pulvis-pyrius CBS 109.77 TaxID=1314802 RepID=A0A6A6WPH5_9PLEO|nr:HET-domain-containing protein [Melanomma pulvis-pyrius CBS 109.77]
MPLPTRLLYVGAVDDPSYDPDFLRLDLGSQIQARTKYIALSHRWGKLLPQEKQNLCTCQGNIGERLKKFNLSDLPKTFQDAVKATRQLRIPYLWIDSLCIIQYGDDGEDWKRESQQMETVFSGAYCTIAATSATNWNKGFLERAWTSESLYVESPAGQQVYVSTDIDDFDEDVGKAELNNRAWVMQESVLARRTIHFTANQIYFECGEGVSCENLIKLQSPPLRKKYFTLDPIFPSRLVNAGHGSITEFIRFLIENYSERGLTKQTDRCVAMSGLHTRIARTIGCDGRYGTLETYLHRNLLWHASNLKLQKIEYKSYVPSWSWMAYHGGIRFLDEKELPVGEVHWITSLCFDKDRDCDHALIADVGVFKNCTMELEGSCYAVFNLSKTNRGWIRYDVEDGKNLLEEHCVVVGSTKNSEDYYILLVRPTTVDGEYERVGIGRVSKNCLVRTRANVRVV